MKTSDNGINLIKKFEGVRLSAYKALPSEPYYTIGYGHYGPDVKASMVITMEEAEDYLREDVTRFERYVSAYVSQGPLSQNQFDALVSFSYNCGAGNLKKLVTGRTLPEIADAMLLYNKAGGKVYDGLTRRRKAERELFMKGMIQKKEKKVDIIIGSARINENGNVAGGQRGDQKQKSSPDYAGEVSMQEFYSSKKGWWILRPKDETVAIRLAAAMIDACNNNNIGYDQNRRLEIMDKGTATKTPCSCDCSSLVRRCVLEASGKDPGNFTTQTEGSLLKATGLFEEKREYKQGVLLYTGDVLVTKTKGHTVIVTFGYPRLSTSTGLYPCFTGVTTSIVTALKEVGEDDASFEHRKIIALVNGINDYEGTAAQNTFLLNLLRQGRLIRG